MIRRRSSIARGKAPNRVNRKRKAGAFAKAYGSEARVAFVKGLPCVARHECFGEIQNVHIRGGGAGIKAEARFIVPGCALLHHELHTFGVVTVQAKYRIDMIALAAATEAAWRASGGEDGE